jgi:arabinose-5-phosphate isomerase
MSRSAKDVPRPVASDELDPLHIGRDVLAREGAALLEVRERLGDSFRRAVELLENASGRIILVGVGKSGLIAAKVAATLTSVGRPAFFLHPTDALHGDLGIVNSGDVALVFSKSGRSAELLNLLPFSQRLGVAVVAVVASADSPLGKEATCVLELGHLEEACSLDLVPTTSTTAALAVGDALAVAVLRRRGLKPEDFAFVHPGGIVGRSAARRVRSVMKSGTALPVLTDTATLKEALAVIVDKGLGMTVLTDGKGLLSGVLTDGDLKRIFLGPDGGRALEHPVSAYMSRTPRTIDPEASIAAAVREMETPRPGPVTALVVVQGAKPLGILHLHDCLKIEPA